MDESQDTLVASLRAENEALKRQLALQTSLSQDASEVQSGWEGCGLTGSQVSRYSRQLVLPSFGPQGMLLKVVAPVLRNSGQRLRLSYALKAGSLEVTYRKLETVIPLFIFLHGLAHLAHPSAH